MEDLNYNPDMSNQYSLVGSRYGCFPYDYPNFVLHPKDRFTRGIGTKFHAGSSLGIEHSYERRTLVVDSHDKADCTGFISHREKWSTRLCQR